MTRGYLAVLLLAACCAPARAQQKGQLGLGPLIGYPMAATAKYFLSERDAVDLGAGKSDDVTFHADYVWHGWKVLPQPSRGPLALTLAAGPRVELQTHADFGIRTMAGLSYWPKLKRAAEFFIELGPTFRLTNGERVRVDGGVGFRLYFTP
ncbi:MAG: hypothetical protein HY926_06290 [Elusimicrobia bacterium]|nr:hypothetical protein [Elusimicrobiota bacterium]